MSQTTTEEHRPPARDDGPSGEPILLAAFPTPAAFPLPGPSEPLGRAFLAERGVIDGEVSSKHLRFSRPGGRIHVEDLGSRNGTFIGGHALRPREAVPLEDGAVVRIGRTILVFRERFEGPLAPETPLGTLVGPFGLQNIRRDLARLTHRPVPNVLILGETGTGKELLAEQVTRALGRAGKPFAAVNVAAMPATVFEAHLFGWKKGSFSGSADGGEGILRAHARGTVFLDELGELAPELQPKMLRLLENREVLPVGESRPVKVDVHLVAATNRDIEDMIDAGTFRRDLYARFLARIEIPPLRERPEDLFAIVEHLFQRRGVTLDPRRVEVEALERLMLAPFRANVRDLDLLVTYMEPSGGLTLRAVSEFLGVAAGDVGARPLSRDLVNRVLAECKGNKSEAARRLGVDRARLLRLLRKIAEEG
ncbi:sigma 54-interacting transcriptional regulator [Polyangium fumosum]|nr:sigma 54-interacting transcriptional regulator [Polyangium fumosum]